MSLPQTQIAAPDTIISDDDVATLLLFFYVTALWVSLLQFKLIMTLDGEYIWRFYVPMEFKSHAVLYYHNRHHFYVISSRMCSKKVSNEASKRVFITNLNNL